MTPPRPKSGILDIAPYIGGKSKAAGFDNPIKLSSNENVLGCSPEATKAYLAAAGRLHLYPDGKATVLRDAIAQRFKLEPESLTFGCGSDELFMLLAQVYLEPGDNIVQTEFAFLSYRICARACQAEVRSAPQPDLRIDVDEILALVDDRTKLVFVAIPDNPTGAWLAGDELRRLHAELPENVILVLDAAYYEYATDPTIEDPIAFARGKANVIVTRTFSKMHGLAGLRVGWGYADPAIIDAIERIRLPFNVSIPAQEAAVAALADEDFVARSLALVEQWRPWMNQQIGGLGLEVYPTQTNFVLVRCPPIEGRTARDAEAFLAGRGILVRGLANYAMGDFLRITVGLEDQNRALVDGLAAFMDSQRG
ncbi:MAG: histidinol-phosphate transaminase [Caulobacterales bacterium 32-69-10]|nr:MAG: histidinol-phosphate transaminase [Caulobacterales bacterium 32-69-10]